MSLSSRVPRLSESLGQRTHPIPDCLQIVRATQAPRRSMKETFPTAKVGGSERDVIARKNFQKGEIWRCSFGSSPESHPRLCEPKRLHRGYKHPWDKG